MHWVAGMKHLLLASSLLLPTTLLAACSDDGGGDPTYDARFASADEATRARALAAAGGADYAVAYFVGSAYAGFDEATACPRVERSGSTTTVTGGCTNDDGTRYEGRIVLDNVAGFFSEDDSVDPTRSQQLDFEDFSIIDADGELLIDGSVEVRPAAEQRVVADLYAAFEGEGVHSHLDLTFTESGMSTLAAGSWIEVDGLGGARASGTFNMSTDTPAGALTLAGADTLVADFDAVEGSCVPLTIDGAPAGELCDTAE